MVLCMPRVAPEKRLHRPPGTALSAMALKDDMAKMTYREQLLHPNWQRKRLEVLSLHGFECTNCGDKEKTLHVHHKKYVKGRMAWEYEAGELDCLCADCHQREHDSRELLDRILADVGGRGLDVIVGLAAGYLMGTLDLDTDLAEEVERSHRMHFEIGLAATLLDGGPISFPWRRFVLEQTAWKPTYNPIINYYAELWRGELHDDGQTFGLPTRPMQTSPEKPSDVRGFDA